MGSIKYLLVLVLLWTGQAHGAALSPYIGLVASRSVAPTTLNSTNRQAMSRSPHYARTRICRAAIVVPNFMVQTASPFAEAGSGSVATVTASLEYPPNVMTQITFDGGNTSGSVPNAGMLTSDTVEIPGCIPNGAQFAVRTYWVSTTGVLSTAVSLNLVGMSGFETGVSGITDKTMSGNVSQSSTNFPPVAIIGTTDQPTFAFVGDSIAYGQGDAQDVGGDYGFLAKTLGPRYAYTHLARSGDQADKFAASSTNRTALFAYVSHVISEYGTNDLYTLGATAAATLTDLQAIWSAAHSAGAMVYQTTIVTRATSSNGYVTPDDQVITSGNDKRITLNASIRSSTDHDGYFDIADLLEDARDGGKWKLGQVANYWTSDGTHPTAAGYALVRDSGIVTLDPQGGRGVLMPAAGPYTAIRPTHNVNSKAVLSPAGR